MVKQYYKTDQYGRLDISGTSRAMEATSRFLQQWQSGYRQQHVLQDRYKIHSVQDLEQFLTKLYDVPSLQDRVLRDVV